MDTIKRKRGPKPYSDKSEVFYARCSPETKRLLIEVVEGKAGSSGVKLVPAVATPVDVSTPAPPAVPDRGQISALLDDVDRLEKERDMWKGKFEKAVEATQDQLAAYWKREYLKLKASVAGKSDFDQTT